MKLNWNEQNAIEIGIKNELEQKIKEVEWTGMEMNEMELGLELACECIGIELIRNGHLNLKGDELI